MFAVPLDDPDHVSMVEFLAGGGSGGLNGQVGKWQIKANCSLLSCPKSIDV